MRHALIRLSLVAAALLGAAVGSGFAGQHDAGIENHTLILPSGIRLQVEREWRSDREIVHAALRRQPQGVTDLSRLQLQPTGHLLTLAPPLSIPGQASVEISVFPGGASQSSAAGLTARDLPNVDADIRARIEGDAKKSNVTILQWHGTSKSIVGGKHALVTRYRYRDATGTVLNMESYSFHLGSRGVFVRLQYTDENGETLKTKLEKLKKSLQLE